MSNNRHLRIAQSIKRELSQLVQRDLKDERISGLFSITDVEVSQDCRSARVYVSIYGNAEDQKNTMEALNDHLSFIRGEICRRLQIRFAPEISFRLDDSLERGSRVSELLSKIATGEEEA